MYVKLRVEGDENNFLGLIIKKGTQSRLKVHNVPLIDSKLVRFDIEHCSAIENPMAAKSKSAPEKGDAVCSM